MIEMFSYEFVQNACWSALLASVVCGVVGSLVVVNRISFLAGGIAHAAYGGVGLALFLGWPVFYTALGFSSLSAGLVSMAGKKGETPSDALMSAIWALGMALGIVLMDLAKAPQKDLLSFLFGGILAVSVSDLVALAWLVLLVALVTLYFFRDFLALSFDPDYAASRGVRVGRIKLLLYLMIAAAVVGVVKVTGLILVLAMLTIPPLIAIDHVRSVAMLMLVSVGLNLLFSFGGLLISLFFNPPAGAAIVILASGALFAHMIFQRFAKPDLS